MSDRYGGGVEAEDVTWSEVDRARDKLARLVFDSDRSAAFDVKDSFRRYSILRDNDLKARRSWVSFLLTGSLAVYGVVFLSAFFLVPGGSKAEFLLSNPSRLGDFLMGQVVVIAVSVLAMVVVESFRTGCLSRYLYFSEPGKKPSSLILSLEVFFARAKRVAVGFQAVSLAVSVLVLLASLVTSSATAGVYSMYLDLSSQMPGVLRGLARPYIQNSPFGFSVFGLIPVLLVSSAVLSSRFAYTHVKIYVKALSLSPEDVARPEERNESSFELDYSYHEAVKEIDTEKWNLHKLTSVPRELRDSPYPGYREVERYWSRIPYSYVKIHYSDALNDYKYEVVEPELEDEEEKMILDEIESRLHNELITLDSGSFQETSDGDKTDKLVEKTVEIINEYNLDCGSGKLNKLLYLIKRDYVWYDRIDPLMNDDRVEEVSCDGDDTPIYLVHKDYNNIKSNMEFGDTELRQLIVRLAQKCGEHISKAEPTVGSTLPDGSRIQMSLGSEVTTKGSTFTIRKFEEIPFTPIDLIRTNTFAPEQLAYLWMMIENGKSMIVAGGTGSGKTTTMNAISLFIPPKSKIVSIEDTRELSLPHQNWVPGVTRESVKGEASQEITMYDLLRDALRQRPEYMVVGEIRGEQDENKSTGQTLFQAMSTGHTTYSTMHADSVSTAAHRLTNDPINVPKSMLTSLDIMCIQAQIHINKGDSVKNVRRNMAVHETDVEARNVSDREITSNLLYEFQEEADGWIGDLANSKLVRELSQESDMSVEEIIHEIHDRTKVLEYMEKNDIRAAPQVSRVIQTYMLNKNQVLSRIQNGNLDPNQLSEVGNISFGINENNLNIPEITDREDRQKAAAIQKQKQSTQNQNQTRTRPDTGVFDKNTAEANHHNDTPPQKPSNPETVNVEVNHLNSDTNSPNREKELLNDGGKGRDGETARTDGGTREKDVMSRGDD